MGIRRHTWALLGLIGLAACDAPEMGPAESGAPQDPEAEATEATEATDPAADEPTDEAPEAPAVESFKALQARSRIEIDGQTLYLVEGDMLFDLRQLREYSTDLTARAGEKSVVNLSGGVRDVRANSLEIGYCYAAGWGAPQGRYTAPGLAPVQGNLELAMRRWEGVAGVRFRHRTALDGVACTVNGGLPVGVQFIVQHWDGGPNGIAIGPFPSNAEAQQALLVPPGGLPRALAVHELGHALGFRHEFTHPDSGWTGEYCEGGATDVEALTGYDQQSVMMYFNCAVSQNIRGGQYPSALDGKGARLLYGAPPWWAGVTRPN